MPLTEAEELELLELEELEFNESKNTQPSSEPEIPKPSQTRMQAASVDDSSVGKAFASIPGADVFSEFTSGAVRGVTKGADFFTTGPVNAISELAGSDFRVPTFTESAQSAGAGREGFMEPGTAQQVVGTAGEFAPAVVSMASQASGIPTAVDRVFSNGIKALESGSPQAKAIAERLTNVEKVKTTVKGIKSGDVAQAGKKLTPTGAIVTDKALNKAATQGFDKGVLSSLRAGSPKDKQKLIRILNLREAGLKNTRAGMVDRASDVVGGSIKSRIDTVYKVNREAGERIGRESRKLQGRVDFDGPISQFFDDLAERGVTMGDEGLEFAEDALFKDLPASERLLKVISKRAELLLNSKNPRKAHELKRFIDEQVTYGKSEGLGGEAEALVKNFRRSIDGILDDTFDGYRKANEDYAATIDVLDRLQKAAGSKIDITGVNADKSLGTLARTVMSNNRGRIELVNALDDLQSVANKFGGKFDDDMLLQALFVDELDTVFKPASRTSLAGDVAKSTVDVGVDLATGGGTGGVLRAGVKHVGDKFKGRNQENALKAIREFLEQ